MKRGEFKMNKITLTPDFYGNYRLFKLFHIQLSDTILNRFLAKRIVSIVFLTILFSIFGFFAIFAIQNYSEISFYFNDRSHLFALYFSFFALLSLALCLHEWAHYFTYKLFGGNFAKMGFGVSFGFFPVMYITLSTDFQKYKTLKNIAIALAGPLLDFTLALLGLYLVSIFKDNYFLWNLFSLFSFGLFFRGLNNFNFLLPGTDAYHILSDSLRTAQLFKKSLGEWKLVLTHQKSELSLSKKLFYLFYGLLSISMILLITTLFFFFTIFLPFI